MKRNPLSFVCMTTTLCVAMALTACSNTPTTGQAEAPAGQQSTASKQTDAIITIGLNADPPSLDPQKSTALVDQQVYASLYDRLVDMDEKMNFVPMLAESWKISDDGKTYTFVLRKGVKFHDGTDFDADAVVVNFERMMDPNVNSPRRAEIKDVGKVNKIDSHTLEVQLKQPFSSFLSMMADRPGMMLSPTALKVSGNDFLNNPVGTGPFKFKSRLKGDSISLVRNNDYWKTGLPKAAGIVYKTVTDENAKVVNLMSGQLDIIDTVPALQVPTLQQDGRIKLVMADGLGYQGLWLNNAKAPLNKKEVRQAISLALDREGLVKVVFGTTALPASTAFPPGTPANDGTPIPKRDVQKAKELLAGAGMTGKVSIGLKIAPTPVQQQIAQVIQQMLGEAGITVKIEQEEFGQILAKVAQKNYDMAQIGWAGRVDPDGNIYQHLFSGSGLNYGSYSNQKVDELLNRARQVSDITERKAIYSQITQIVLEDVPYVYIWHPKEVRGINPALQGFVHIRDMRIHTDTLSK